MADFQTGIIQHAGKEFVRSREIDSRQQLENQSPRAGMMPGFEQELSQLGQGELGTGLQLAAGDGVGGGTQPIQGIVIRAVHPFQNRQQRAPVSVS